VNDNDEWFAQHRAYLATPEWRNKRELVLARDHHVCHAVLIDCAGVASEVHHLTYRHWREEPLFDLESVCSSCHRKITFIERRERAEQMLAAYARKSVPRQPSLPSGVGEDDLVRYRRILATRDPDLLNASERESYELIKALVAESERGVA